MSEPASIRTKRLILRQWRASDRAAFAQINADSTVMKHFPGPLNRVQSDAFAERIEASIDQNGWGLWAVEVIDGPEFIGFVGLVDVPFDEHFTPATEIGWRLAASAWGNGYATEAAQEVLKFGLTSLRKEEIVSFTIMANRSSWKVMERIGMTRDPDDDFNHPNMSHNHPMERHILYRARAH